MPSQIDFCFQVSLDSSVWEICTTLEQKSYSRVIIIIVIIVIIVISHNSHSHNRFIFFDIIQQCFVSIIALFYKLFPY